MNKIDLDDTFQEATVNMVMGNVGALAAIMKHSHQYGQPETMVLLAHLDDMRLYGPNIWLAYKDVNGQDVTKFHDSVFDHSVLTELKKLHYFDLERLS